MFVFRLTISTLASVTPNMRLIDVNGAPHVLTEHQVMIMITLGWTTFLAAWLMNLLNYKFHPSSVNFTPKGKMFFYIFGKQYDRYDLRYNLYRCGKKKKLTSIACVIFSTPMLAIFFLYLYMNW